MSKTSRGFALLIVITLIAFLVLLLVGLAAYTRIETAVAANTQRQEQARANALFALNVALGQLQKYAGPDQRVTATADAFSPRAGTAHYTGVWDSTSSGEEPLIWLVSGNELNTAGAAAPLTITPQTVTNTTNGVALVSTNTSGTLNDVLARLMPITATNVPGTTPGSSTAIGRYAWWIGDQGVKAPVAVPDTTGSITYAPYDSDELRSRLRQQISLGAGAADADGGPIFEPRDTNNAPLVRDEKVTAINQVAFLKNAANTAIGPALVQRNFHAWSPNNFAVLANTKLGGLRQDLSIKPDLLGTAFAAWADYSRYMEDPAGASDSVMPITPEYAANPLRRRYRITAPIEAGGAIFSSAPVLSFVFLQFNVRRVGGNNAASSVNALELRARIVAQLWNPWTSALIPEPLVLEISHLPTVDVTDSNGGSASISLPALLGDPMMVNLTPDRGAAAGNPDDRSWLPGRVYYWRANGGTPGAWGTTFYDRTLNVSTNAWVVSTGSSYRLPAANSVTLTISGPPAQIQVVLRRADGTLLSTTRSPQFQGFTTTPQPVNANDTFQFGYPFRMADPVDFAALGGDGAWLTTLGIDPRSPLVADPLMRTLHGDDPSLYLGVTGNSDFTEPNRLLDRVMGSTGMSYDNDVPVFELPRSPILSLGELQHLQLSGARPFSVGNSWGANASLNGVPTRELFDRFFFSGLTAEVSPTTSNGSLLLPNPTIKVLRASAPGAPPAADDLRTAPNAQSSKFFLQGGAFNLNSVSTEAWMAVLRSVRFPEPQTFSYLDALFASGTSADGKTIASFPDAQFFRFSQSAQETYKADPGYAASSVGPPEPPDTDSIANTHLYRRGMRTLTAEQVKVLAEKITAAIKARQALAGPFRSLEEFLAPSATGGPSLIEQAIADARINVDSAGNPIEFSSQFLTQADIMTALAPVLFARSDTFVIRAYGEAINPALTTNAATPAIEGRAWCEAIVQRVPEYLDSADDATVAPTDLTSETNKTNGRRFKIVSFRWLTRSDI